MRGWSQGRQGCARRAACCCARVRDCTGPCPVGPARRAAGGRAGAGSLPCGLLLARPVHAVACSAFHVSLHEWLPSQPDRGQLLTAALRLRAALVLLAPALPLLPPGPELRPSLLLPGRLLHGLVVNQLERLLLQAGQRRKRNKSSRAVQQAGACSRLRGAPRTRCRPAHSADLLAQRTSSAFSKLNTAGPLIWSRYRPAQRKRGHAALTPAAAPRAAGHGQGGTAGAGPAPCLSSDQAPRSSPWNWRCCAICPKSAIRPRRSPLL